MLSFSQMQSQFQSQMQSEGLTMPPKPEVGPSTARVSTKESCVDPSGNNPDTGNSDKCGLYVEENPPGLEDFITIVHNIPLCHDQVKVGVKKVTNAYAHIPVPTEEVKLVGQTLNIFLAWPTHLVKRLSEQVLWDATVFGVFNDNFPLYIKHEDLSEITHGGQCFSISVIQLHMIETSMRAGNVGVYGFLKPQSIQRSGQSQFESESYIKNWMQNSKRDVYLGAYLNGAHWQMVVILPKENVVIWFCSLHNEVSTRIKPRLLCKQSMGQNTPKDYDDGWLEFSQRNINILIVQYASMFVFNSVLKGLDDTQQSKSKVAARWIVVKISYLNNCNRQKESTECGYYVMHNISTIILGSFNNNWETYFNDVRPLKQERLKTLHI
ncbi:hypothetical protein GmHk_06G016625 [Glycine max]|nr:hypothetical protein GmHk_06G016625 [Glycine max]